MCGIIGILLADENEFVSAAVNAVVCLVVAIIVVGLSQFPLLDILSLTSPLPPFTERPI